MTPKQLRSFAYRFARDAGLDTDTSDAVAGRVVDRVVHGSSRDYTRISGMRAADIVGSLVDHIIREEVQRHAAP